MSKIQMMEINSDAYIREFTRDKSPKELLLDQKSKFTNSVGIGFKSIFYGRKWFIYLGLQFFILAIILVFDTKGYADPGAMYTYYLFENIFPLVFVFGCLILSQPISADEISDKTLDLYLVRPIKRETYWLSRVVVVNTVVFLLNALIYLVIFISFMAFSKDGFSQSWNDNYKFFLNTLVLLVAGTLTYSSLFLLVGMIGNRGFTLGLFLAIFEPIFLSILFLSGNKYIPQTNIMRIVYELYGEDVIGLGLNTDISYAYSWTYVLIFFVLVNIMGAYYLRRREIN